METYLLFSCVFFLIFGQVYCAAPAGCVEGDVNGDFTCDFRITAFPLNSAAFSPQPQRLTIQYVSGTITGASFADLDPGDTVVSWNPGHAIQIDIECIPTETLIILGSSFTGLSWIQRLTFSDCNILSLPNDVFSWIESLDLLHFKGGSIDDIYPNSLHGLVIEKDTTINEPRGAVVFEYTEFLSNRIPAGFLTPTKDTIAEFSVIGANVQLLEYDTIQNLTALAKLDLSGNGFAFIPYDFFDGTNSLSEVRLYDIPWDCSACSATWFFDYAITNYFELYGDFVCDAETTEIEEVTRMRKWYYSDCADASDDSASALEISYFEMVGIGLGSVAFIISLVDLGLIICIKRKPIAKALAKGDKSERLKKTARRVMAANKFRNIKKNSLKPDTGKARDNVLSPSAVKTDVWN